MLVLGVASSPSSSGWTLIDVNEGVGRIVSAGRAAPMTAEAIANIAGMMTALPDPPELVVVGNDRPSEHSYSQAVGRWMQAFESVGVECATVTPAIWQSAVGQSLPADPDRRTLGARAAAVLFGGEIAEADAACMALWAGRKRATY